MSNQQQNEIRSEVEQIKREINLLQDKLKQSEKKKKFYCKMNKSELQKCKPKYQSESQKYKPKKDKMYQTESQKCIIKYRIYFKMKQRKLKGR